MIYPKTKKYVKKKSTNIGIPWQGRSNKMRHYTIVGILFMVQMFNGCKLTERAEHMDSEDSKREMAKIRITTVRYNERQGRNLLRNYIFGGFRAGPRPPRGVEPELVSRFIQEELLPESPAGAYANTVRVLRFYERTDLVAHLRKTLRGSERSAEDLRRSAYAIQAIGEVGTRQETEQAAAYFDQKLVPHAEALNNLALMLETLIVLAPSGSTEKLAVRIDQEVQRRAKVENESEETMMAYDEMLSFQGDHLPRVLNAIQTKKKLLEIKPPKRLSEYVKIYLGLSPGSNDLIQVWVGRMLRREAMESDPEPIYAAFASGIAQADPKKVGEDAMTDTIVNRAAQAIIYLQGRLTKTERELFEKTKLAAMNFLWDDLNM